MSTVAKDQLTRLRHMANTKAGAGDLRALLLAYDTVANRCNVLKEAMQKVVDECERDEASYIEIEHSFRALLAGL